MVTVEKMGPPSFLGAMRFPSLPGKIPVGAHAYTPLAMCGMSLQYMQISTTLPNPGYAPGLHITEASPGFGRGGGKNNFCIFGNLRSYALS